MFDWSSLGAILGNYGTNAGANPVGPLATQAPVGGQSSELFGSLGDWIKKNPEQFAMGLDMAGQAFDPNNVAAGVGTSLAQARLMNKAAKEAEAKQVSEQKAWHEDLLKLLGGQSPTAVGEGGLSSYTTKKDANGLTITATGDVGSKLAKPEDLQLSNPRNIVNPW